MIKAIIFDLDDTLCLETYYVKSGFSAIADAFGDCTLADKLWQLFCQDKSNVYQRAGFTKEQCERAIDIYRNHKPTIKLDDKVVQLLKKLRLDGYKLGIITDGRPNGQRAKIEALGLEKLVDKIIITDELGGVEYRKPNPKAFELMKEYFGVEFCRMVYVGDNPKKDFIAPDKLGMQSVYYKNPNGLYSNAVYNVQAQEITSISEIFTILDGEQ